MFYSETVLSRRGPLGKVWLAAHMERKLSKTQTLQTDIEQSIDAIMGQEIELMALRLSGQLLLGVVRIYSRKAKYLLDDCNEALLKIKMAFRPGVVDLAEDQLTVQTTSITLQPNGVGIDLLLPDVTWDMDFEDRPLQRQGHHQAHVDDITLRTADDLHPFDVNNPFDVGPSDGIESGDFNELDIGIDWGGDDEANKIHDNDRLDMISLDESVGIGRDGGPHRDSLGQDLLARHGMIIDPDILSHASESRGISEPFDAAIAMDVDINLGIGFDDPPLDVMENLPGEARPSSRASSPLTELPTTPPPQAVDTTAAPHTHRNKPKKLKDRKQIIDSVTEISNVNRRGTAAANPLHTDISSITTEQYFLPRSSIVIRLLEIRDDPLPHFLPIQVTPNGTFFTAAPPGLTPELSELFLRLAPGTTAQKRKASSPSFRAAKRLCQDVEQARRAGSLQPSPILEDIHLARKSPGIDAEFEFPDPSAVMDDFELGVPIGLDMDDARARSVATDRSRQSSLGPDAVSYGDSTCPISTFDVRQPTQPSQLGDVDEEQPEIAADHDKHGYSKNSMKALGLIRKELQPGLEQEAERKILNFTKMSHKASRRAAASFFFELLVLGTRDCLQLSQSTPFADIEVSAKPRLWQHQQAKNEIGQDDVRSMRNPSVARSLSVLAS